MTDWIDVNKLREALCITVDCEECPHRSENCKSARVFTLVEICNAIDEQTVYTDMIPIERYESLRRENEQLLDTLRSLEDDKK